MPTIKKKGKIEFAILFAKDCYMLQPPPLPPPKKKENELLQTFCLLRLVFHYWNEHSAHFQFLLQ